MSYQIVSRKSAVKSKTYPDARLVPSPRMLWYNPVLDPANRVPFTPATIQQMRDDGDYPPGTLADGGPLQVPCMATPANLVSSLCKDGRHRPALDIDIPWAEFDDYAAALAAELDHNIICVESAGGNTHVYVPDWSVSWASYKAVLHDLLHDDWIEEAYLAHCKDRGQSLLRMPGCPKWYFTDPDAPPVTMPTPAPADPEDELPF